MKKLTIRIAEAMHKKYRLHAMHQDITLTEFVMKAMANQLKADNE